MTSRRILDSTLQKSKLLEIEGNLFDLGQAWARPRSKRFISRLQPLFELEALLAARATVLLLLVVASELFFPIGLVVNTRPVGTIAQAHRAS